MGLALPSSPIHSRSNPQSFQGQYFLTPHNLADDVFCHRRCRNRAMTFPPAGRYSGERKGGQRNANAKRQALSSDGHGLATVGHTVGRRPDDGQLVQHSLALAIRPSAGATLRADHGQIAA
jgi:hypothetical protein